MLPPASQLPPPHPGTPQPLPFRKRSTPRAASLLAAGDLYDLRFGKIWAFVTRQPPSYWLVTIYLFLEYVRPQHIYPAIQGWPLPFWSIVLCALALLLEGRVTRRWVLLDTLLLGFTAVVLLSSLNAVSPERAFERLGDEYLAWVLVYFLITTAVNTERRVLVFIFAFMVFLLKHSQHGFRGWMMSGFGFQSVGVTCSPGWFQNSGECGVSMAVYFPMALFFITALRPYWSKRKFLLLLFMPMSAAASMVASSSRGALLGFAAVLAWLALLQVRRLNLKVLVAIAVFAGLVWVVIPERQMERLRNMGEDETSQKRLTYWRHAREIMRQHPVLGIGYNNWLPYYRSRYNPEGQLPHNIFYEAGAELGFTGLGVFLAMIGGTFLTNRRTRRLAKALPQPGSRFFTNMAFGLDGALIGFMATGYFVTVLYYPFFWINLAFTTALHLSARSAVAQAGAVRNAAVAGAAGARARLVPRPGGG
jgi:O-antigen ligase